MNGAESRNFSSRNGNDEDRSSHWAQDMAAAPDLEYNQSHAPVREQSVAVGHCGAGRLYVYGNGGSGPADRRRSRCSRRAAGCGAILRRRQMYITGGIGSTHHGEAFSFDYDLPNDTVYAETCASIGLIFFASRMLQLEPKSEYADVHGAGAVQQCDRQHVAGRQALLLCQSAGGMAGGQPARTRAGAM